MASHRPTTLFLNVFAAHNIPPAPKTLFRTLTAHVHYTTDKKEKTRKTEPEKDTLAPVWNKPFALEGIARDSVVTVDVTDPGAAGIKTVATCSFSVDDVPTDERKALVLPLTTLAQQPAGDISLICYKTSSSGDHSARVIPKFQEAETPLTVRRGKGRFRAVCSVVSCDKATYLIDVASYRKRLTSVLARQQPPVPPVVLQFETSGEDVVTATVTSAASGESETVAWACAEVVAERAPHVVVVGGLSVKLHGQYVPPDAIPPEESVPDAPREFEEWCVETAPATEQFVGEGVPALFHVAEPDAYRFETRFEDTTATHPPGDAALNPHYLEGDVALMQRLDPGTLWFAFGPALVLVGDADWRGVCRALVFTTEQTVRTLVLEDAIHECLQELLRPTEPTALQRLSSGPRRSPAARRRSGSGRSPSTRRRRGGR